MTTIRVKENEPFEVAMRRFKRSCEKAGVLAEVHKREFYEKPTQERKRKAAAAVKRHQKKASRGAGRSVRRVRGARIGMIFQEPATRLNPAEVGPRKAISLGCA